MAANPYLFEEPAELTALLEEYKKAEIAVLRAGGSYSLNGMSLTRANLSEIRLARGQIRLALRKATGQAVTVASPLVRTGHY